MADECTGLGVSRNPKSFGKSLSASDEVQPKEDSKILKILMNTARVAHELLDIGSLKARVELE
ncbi:hypothetical protein HanPI659440_Chr13g0510701 [Helianthus annuus]|nr:hypothetical protein HanPI659440_Chr13g0510701 [Helianthus annuus]